MTKTQLTEILNALTGESRKPANAAAAVKAIDKAARERYGLDAPAVMEAAGGLLDGRLSPEEFRAEIQADPEETSANEVKPEEPERPVAGTRGEKIRLLEQLLRREGGATTEEIMEATGWLPHTTRARIHGLRRAGLEVESTPARGHGERPDGKPRMTTKYRVTA